MEVRAVLCYAALTIALGALEEDPSHALASNGLGR